MKVKEFMITDVITIKKDKTVRALLELLVTHKIGGVPVVDDDNRLIGVISDGDVIRYIQPKSQTVFDAFSLILVSEKEDLKHKLQHTVNDSVEKMMRYKGIFTVHPEDSIDEAISIFSKQHLKKIPVIDNGNKVVGVISRGDVIRYISTKLISD